MFPMQDRYRGCLVGGGAGDALGYAVEFFPTERIFAQYGEEGITSFRLVNGRALVSDDTQMTLFTAAGLLKDSGRPTDNVWQCYGEWYLTQFHSGPQASGGFSGLMNRPELWSARAPGNTCLASISGGAPGSIRNPINESKGCGGVMRSAPAGLISPKHPLRAARLGADISALTHSHDLGWLPGAMLGCLIARLVSGERLPDAARDALREIQHEFSAAPDLGIFSELMEKAMALAGTAAADLDCIQALGRGWTGDEAIAIALFCALRYEDNFAGGIIAAVNHGGDSDSTGAITGNILGAHLGCGAIPDKFKTDLELADLLAETADRLYYRALDERKDEDEDE